MLKTAIKLGFIEKNPDTGKAVKVQDAFTYFEPASWDELLVDTDKQTALEWYNAHRRVMCQNGGGRDFYIAYKQGRVTLPELEAFISNWKPGDTYESATGSKAEKQAAKALANPESAAIIALSLGITLEQLMAMRKSAALLSADVPETDD